LIDQIPVDVQLRIVELYKGGMSMRQIGELLVREGVESPDMVVPWGTAVISIVINTHK
jgi:transposase-like protein